MGRARAFSGNYLGNNQLCPTYHLPQGVMAVLASLDL